MLLLKTKTKVTYYVIRDPTVLIGMLLDRKATSKFITALRSDKVSFYNYYCLHINITHTCVHKLETNSYININRHNYNYTHITIHIMHTILQLYNLKTPQTGPPMTGDKQGDLPWHLISSLVREAVQYLNIISNVSRTTNYSSSSGHEPST